MLNLMTGCASCLYYYEYFSKNKKEIFYKIILPLLLLNEDEETLFVDSPIDFFKLSMDCVDS